MKTLDFDDGVINLDVNGTGRIFSFNPTDTKIYEGFLEMVRDTPQKLNQLSVKAEKLEAKKLDENERTAEELKIYAEIDKILREAFDNTFGEGQADIMFGTQVVCSLGSNGDFVFSNGLMALFPYFEKETKKRKQKVKSVVAQYK